MGELIVDRTLEVAKYIVEEKATLRKAASKFGISKSTVHKDMTDRLQTINNPLYKEVKDVIQYNKDARYLRGGLALKKKREQNKRLEKQQEEKSS